jgi:hypothetical protein
MKDKWRCKRLENSTSRRYRKPTLFADLLFVVLTKHDQKKIPVCILCSSVDAEKLSVSVHFSQSCLNPMHPEHLQFSSIWSPWIPRVYSIYTYAIASQRKDTSQNDSITFLKLECEFSRGRQQMPF